MKSSILVLTLLACSAKYNLVEETIYDFRLPGIEGREVDFSQYKGKYILIVNTASRCGYTPQYKALQDLYELYGEKVAVLGFPANNFLWQEPGSNNEIAEFCSSNYGVTFPMFEKISVKGRDKHPLYQWLERESGETPSWNFCKFLIDREGHVIGYFPSKIGPMDDRITSRLI